MKIEKHSIIGFFFALSITLIITRGIISSNSLIAYEDLHFPFSKDVYPILSTWDQFSQSTTILNHRIFNVWLGIFDGVMAQNLSLFVLIFMVSFISFWSIRETLKDSFNIKESNALLASSLFSSLLFTFNPIVVVRLRHYFLLWFYAFLPLLFLVSFRLFSQIRTGATYNLGSLKVALVLFIMSASIRMPYYFLVPLFALLGNISRPLTKFLKESVFAIIRVLFLYCLFSSFWLLPVVLETLGGKIPAPQHYVLTDHVLEVLSQNASILNVITLRSFWDTKELQQLFNLKGIFSSIWPCSLLSIPLLASSSLLIYKKNRRVVSIICLLVVVVFLAKGSNEPVSSFYPWLVFESPLSIIGWEFRGPNKWNLLIMFCYSILGSFTLYWFLTKIDIGNVGKKTKHLWKALMVLGLIFLFTVPGYPLFSGTFTYNQNPVKKVRPDDNFLELYRQAKKEEFEYRVFTYPKRPPFGVPSRGVNTAQYYNYILTMARENKTNDISAFLSPLNIKYIYLYEQTPMFDSLGLLRTKHFYIVPSASPQIYVVNSLISVQRLESLSGICGFVNRSERVSISFNTFVLTDMISRSEIIILNPTQNLFFSVLGEEVVLVSPFDKAYVWGPWKSWSRASTSDPLHGSWHPYLEERDIENWDFDYGKGLVFTWAALRLKEEPATLEVQFQIRETDDYVFLTRYFQNQQGGKIRIQLDNKEYTINTKDQLNKFAWKEIDTISLEKGQHKITLTNLEGFNAINLFTLIPKQEYQNAPNQLDETLQNKRIIYILEAENDLYHENTTTSNKHGGEASNGEVLELTPTSRVWNELEILKPGNYTIVIRGKGNLNIKIDEKEYTANSAQLDWTYLGPIILEKGKHEIKITPSSTHYQPSDLDVVWLYSTQKENETLEEIFTPKENPAEIISYQKIDPTKYIVEVNATKPFMLSFAEAHDPLWIAHVNGERIESIPLYSVINGFWINQTGQLEITIEYEPQKWFYYGSIISVTTFLACLTYLTYNWTKNKAIWKRTKRSIARVRLIFHLNRRKKILLCFTKFSSSQWTGVNGSWIEDS